MPRWAVTLLPQPCTFPCSSKGLLPCSKHVASKHRINVRNSTHHSFFSVGNQDLHAHAHLVLATDAVPQCGHYIAKECGMTGAEARVMLGDVDGASGDVAWSLMDSSADSGAVQALSTPALMEVCD